MSGSQTLSDAQAAFASAAAISDAASASLVAAQAALTTARAALLAAQMAVAAPQPTDDPATLIANLTAAQAAVTQAELLEGINRNRASAATTAMVAANNDVFSFAHADAVQARIAAATTLEQARATIATANAQYDAATAALQRLYGSGYPRRFDGMFLAFQDVIPVRIRSVAAETALWGN